MRTFKLDFGWEIALPDGWIMDRRERGSYIFYPDDTDDETTVYASAFHAENHRVLAPEYAMRESFEKSVPAGAQEVEIISELHSKAFFIKEKEHCRIGTGFFTDGNLLSLNVFANDEEKVKNVFSCFQSVKFSKGGKYGF